MHFSLYLILLQLCLWLSLGKILSTRTIEFISLLHFLLNSQDAAITKVAYLRNQDHILISMLHLYHLPIIHIYSMFHRRIRLFLEIHRDFLKLLVFLLMQCFQHQMSLYWHHRQECMIFSLIYPYHLNLYVLLGELGDQGSYQHVPNQPFL